MDNSEGSGGGRSISHVGEKARKSDGANKILKKRYFLTISFIIYREKIPGRRPTKAGVAL